MGNREVMGLVVYGQELLTFVEPLKIFKWKSGEVFKFYNESACKII